MRVAPGNPRFFVSSGPHALTVIAAAIGCEAPAWDTQISRPRVDRGCATAGQISFLGDPRHAALLDRTRAGAVIVPPGLKERVPSGCAALVTGQPFVAWAAVAALFHPAPAIRAGIHPTALVAPDAAIDASVEVAAHAMIGSGAEIGPRCLIGHGAVIGDGVVIGPDCRIGPRAVISHAILGARVQIYRGVCIGQEGFGFQMTGSGFVSMPQLGIVILEDDVEVGANSTIDRGALRDTVVGRGTRLDNLVQVAHNVRIGQYCALAAQVGIARVRRDWRLRGHGRAIRHRAARENRVERGDLRAGGA